MLAFQCMCVFLWVRVNVHVYIGHLLLFCLEEQHAVDDGKGKGNAV